jgi:hypothetical protein
LNQPRGHWPTFFSGGRFTQAFEDVDIPAELFRPARDDETILSGTKSFFTWHAELQKRPLGITSLHYG